MLDRTVIFHLLDMPGDAPARRDPAAFLGLASSLADSGDFRDAIQLVGFLEVRGFEPAEPIDEDFANALELRCNRARTQRSANRRRVDGYTWDR